MGILVIATGTKFPRVPARLVQNIVPTSSEIGT